MSGVKKSIESMGESMRKAGSALREVSEKAIFVGAAIAGPMGLAMARASQYSADATRTMNKLKNTFDNISITISKSVTPIFESLVEILSGLVDWFERLPKSTRDTILQFTLLGGVSLTAVGVVARFTGSLIILASTIVSVTSGLIGFLPAILAIGIAAGLIIKNWDILKDFFFKVSGNLDIIKTAFKKLIESIIYVVGSLVGAVVKAVTIFFELISPLFKPIEIYIKFIELIINGISKYFKMIGDIVNIATGIMQGAVGVLEKISSTIFSMISDALWWLSKLSDWGSKIPFLPFKNEFKDLSIWLNEAKGNMDGLSKSTDELANKNLKEAADLITKVFKGEKIGNNILDSSIKKLIEVYKNVLEMIEKFKSLSSEKKPGNFFEGFKKGLEDIKEQLGDFGALGVKVAHDMASAMNRTFSDLFFDVFTGKLDDLGDVFKRFSESLLRIITDVMAQLATKKIIEGLSGMAEKGGAFSGVMQWISGVMSKHDGGVIRAHSGMALNEGLVVKQGEGIMSEAGMRTLGPENFARINRGMAPAAAGSGGNMVVIQAWDTSDIMRNSKTIEAIIANALQKNTPLRSIVKRS
jgi:lambda family phage tail tape measure protein